MYDYSDYMFANLIGASLGKLKKGLRKGVREGENAIKRLKSKVGQARAKKHGIDIGSEKGKAAYEKSKAHSNFTDRLTKDSARKNEISKAWGMSDRFNTGAQMRAKQRRRRRGES